MPEKVAVIGSNSFSGSYFINFLLQRNIQVMGISRSPEPADVFLPYKWDVANGKLFEFNRLDLNHDLKKLMDKINSFKPNYIVNFAAQSMVAESWQHPEHWYQTNVVATIKFHDKLRKLDFIKRYVHVSTPEVYGNCEGVVKESSCYNPSTPYAVSRAATDMSLMSFFKAYNFPVIFTRAANVYGPGQQLYRIIPRTILYFLTGRKLELHGGGESLRSFIHMRDVSDGTLTATLEAEPGEIFHFSTEENVSIRSLVELIAEKLKVPFEEHVDIVEERLGQDSAYLLDSSKAKKILKWENKTTLERGVDETIVWVRNNLNELLNQPFDYVHKS